MPYYVGYKNHFGVIEIEEFETHDIDIKEREQMKKDVGRYAEVSIPFHAETKE